MDVKTVENGTETTDINEKPKVYKSKEKDDDKSVEIESKIWESGKIEDKDFWRQLRRNPLRKSTQ